MKEVLRQIGLAEDEAAVYAALLSLGPSTVGQILEKVSREIKTKRTNLYYILRSLKTKGLLTEKKKAGKTIFMVESPTHLFNLVEEKTKEVGRIKKTLAMAMPELSSLYNLTTNKPIVQFFEGMDGFKRALWDSLTAKETILTYSDIQSIQKYQREVNEEYVAERLKMGINKKILSMDTPFARNHYAKKDMRFTEVRFLPKELKVFEIGMQLYDNKVCYYTPRKENMISVIIQDKGLYQMNKNIFEYLWQISKK